MIRAATLPVLVLAAVLAAGALRPAAARATPTPVPLAERCDTALRQALAQGPWGSADSVAFSWQLPPLANLPADALVEAEALLLREAGTSTVALRLLDQGRCLRRLVVPVRVRRWRLLPVARADLPRGRVLGAADLEERWMETTHLAAADLPALGEVVGRRLERYLVAGRHIPARLLEQVPDVRRGEALTVTVVSGGVRISAGAEALEDARVGESLKVRLSDTGRRLDARLTAPGRAEVEVAG